MVGIFKQKSAGNALLLLIYGLILKFNMFLHPAGPLQQTGDHYLYSKLLQFLQYLHLPPTVFAIITFVLLYLQATLFNRICNAQKMLAKPSYLPAMAFLLITSLFSEWNQFSAQLIINSILIWVFYRMASLYSMPKAGAAIYNIGILLGIVSLLYHPAIVFVLLIVFTLFIMRPFQIREWVIAFLGITTPYYFLAILLFLTNQWNWKFIVPAISFDLPSMPSSVFVTISIALLVIPFIIGGFYVQNNLNKMLIQVRKNWSLLLLFLIMAVFIIIINSGNNYMDWLLCAIPLTAFHAAAYFYPPNRTFPEVLHGIVFAYAIYVNYVL